MLGMDADSGPVSSVHVPRQFATLPALAAAVGQRLGESGWHEVTQWQVDRFAEATGDNQWIHVDQRRAATGPFGGTIAHGYLVLSLLPKLLGEAFEVGGLGMMVNTGVDTLRFLAPVPVGARLRLTADLLSAVPRVRGAVEVVIDAWIELYDRPDPVCRGQVGMILRPVRPARTGRAIAGQHGDAGGVAC
jgi:acyl dehydratase